MCLEETEGSWERQGAVECLLRWPESRTRERSLEARKKEALLTRRRRMKTVELSFLVLLLLSVPGSDQRKPKKT